MTDEKIIELFSGGMQEEAFRGIVDAYTERLYWHVRRFLCSHEDTNDLLQDIFIKIWSALPSFRGEARLYTWIYRVATNEVLNHLRKQKFKALISLDSASALLERKIDEDISFNGDELQRELHKAIQRLPEKQRIGRSVFTKTEVPIRRKQNEYKTDTGFRFWRTRNFVCRKIFSV